MGVLILGPEQRAAIDAVVEYAQKPEHHYLVGADQEIADDDIPGNSPHYVVHLGTYRCVFTITMTPSGTRYRHLSVSTWTRALPNPVMVEEIAKAFGFEPEKSAMWRSPIEHCVMVAQRATTETGRDER